VWLFFYQVEDRIRGFHVTGVQTCALPISGSGGTTSASSLTVVPGTPLSAGLSGSVTAASSSVAWGRPSSGVARAGTVAVNVGGEIGRASCRERVHRGVIVATPPHKRRHHH